MRKKYLPLIALAAGFISALITAGVHSMLFVLLPLWAFVFGYFSSWRCGLLNSVLLFLGHTVATATMWRNDLINVIYPLQYFYAFIFGGFSILIIGALAPIVRKDVRKIESVAVLVILALLMVWCGFQTWPTYSYYYQVIIHSSENVDSVELYLPAGVVSGDIHEELYDSPLEDPMAPLTRDYTQQMVDTEHGRMLKLDIFELREEGPPGYPYTGNVIFWQPAGFRNRLVEIVMPWQRGSAPYQLIRLMPRYDAVPVNTAESQNFIGPVKVRESVVVEEFRVPIKIKSSTDADYELRLENRTSRGAWINFTYSKSNTHPSSLRMRAVLAMTGYWFL